jgi:SAM-dependent methyltransferase
MNNYICPICDSTDISIFIKIPQIPVYCNLLYKSREEAVAASRADMELGYCEQCGHVYNFAFDPAMMDYTLDYENSLHFSPRFQEYAENLARNLIERYQLYGKDVVEIGCGDGDFLDLLCRAGNNRGFGFDPSHVPDLDKTGGNKRITFIRDYYSEKYSDYKADLICCRHVLEHIQQPRQFLKNVRSALKGNTGTIVFFEVPNVLYTLKDLGIWDLIYEHCSYFSSTSLRTVFKKAGFEVIRDSEEFQGQFLGIEAKSAREAELTARNQHENSTDLSECVERFEKNFRKKMTQWAAELERMEKDGRSAVVWGAGSKGATFLNNLKIRHQIKYVVDINPRKQGKFVAGTGQKIVPPEFLTGYQPEIIIVMNPNYLPEIDQRVSKLKLKSELVVV